MYRALESDISSRIMPLITLNHKDDMVKISARGTKPLISRGLDLSVALRKAAEAVGGAGGGHTIASGASVPPGAEEKFLALVDEIVGEQLHGTAKESCRPPGNRPVMRHDPSPSDLLGREGQSKWRWLLSPIICPICIFRRKCERVCLQFSTEKIGTLLSTVDDLLMNIKIAEET